MKINKGYSLVELMVTIAIIAILASVAMPAYKRYLVSTKINSLLPSMDNLIHRAITFMNANGVFPNTSQLLGLNTAASGLLTPSSTIANVLKVSASDIAFGGSPCGQSGQVSFLVDTNSLGINDKAKLLTLTCLMGTVATNVKSMCFYTYSSSGSAYYNYASIPLASTAATATLAPDLANAGAGSFPNVARPFFAGTNCTK